MSVSEKYPSPLQRHFFMSATEIFLISDIRTQDSVQTYVTFVGEGV
jgi:hypothetical protein